MSSFDAAFSYAPATTPSPEVPTRAQRPLGFWATIGWTVTGLSAAAAFAVLVVIAGLIWNIAHAGRTLTDAQLQDLAQVATSGGFLLLVGMLVVACRHAGWRASDYLAVTRPHGRYIRLAVVALVVPLAIVLLLSYSGFTLAADSEIPKSTVSLAITLMALTVVAPVWEELVFRGFLYRGLAASRLGVGGAIVVTALLWASLHLDRTVLGMVETFSCGLVWGWLRWRTGSTAVTMAVHCANNTIAGVALLGVALGWWT